MPQFNGPDVLGILPAEEHDDCQEEISGEDRHGHGTAEPGASGGIGSAEEGRLEIRENHRMPLCPRLSGQTLVATEH